MFSVYQLFFDMLPMAQAAHQAQNRDLLERIYQYAEWCWKQKNRADDVYNAVCVAFYEHLVDEAESCAAIPQWIKPEIFADIHDVFEPRMTQDNYHELLARYNAVHRTRFE